MGQGLSIIIPAYNEEDGITPVVAELHDVMKGIPYEIIVVDDGSTDKTLEVLKRAEGIRWVAHPMNRGYGASLKSGIRIAKYDLIAIADADGTYPVKELPGMLECMDRYDMVIGCRSGDHFWGPISKQILRKGYRWWAEWIAGTEIPDVNSGFRIFRKVLAERFGFFLSDRFSFTTGLTLAALTNNYAVKYISVAYYKRIGMSKVFSVMHKVGIAQILVHAALLFAPMKLILPLLTLFGGGSIVLFLACLLFPSPYLFVTAVASLSLTMVTGLTGLVLIAVSKLAKK